MRLEIVRLDDIGLFLLDDPRKRADDPWVEKMALDHQAHRETALCRRIQKGIGSRSAQFRIARRGHGNASQKGRLELALMIDGQQQRLHRTCNRVRLHDR